MSIRMESGRRELRKALLSGSRQFLAIAIFSIVVNLLMLTGPLFMLQVYDRVLTSRSESTLLALVALISGLFVLMAVLDHLRGRIAARVGAQFQARFDLRLFRGAIGHWRAQGRGREGAQALRDLESLQRFLGSQGVFAFFDLPWTPVYILIIWSFDPLLGWFSLGSVLLLIVISWANQRASAGAERESMRLSVDSERFSSAALRDVDTVVALGMQAGVASRWRALRDRAIDAQITLSDRGGLFAAVSKSLRLYLQSAVLAIGAWLVLEGRLTAGAMIAASILLGRALAPIELAISQSQFALRAADGWRNLRRMLPELPEEAVQIRLPRPKAHLKVENLVVGAPGANRALLRGVSFEVKPGEVLAVLGTTGAGKSTLARALTGIWLPAAGSIRLDGAALHQYDDDALGRYLGYLPQEVRLFDGTLAENIARMDENPTDALVIEAARRADIHEVILRLEKGYESMVSGETAPLSGGQRQRLGLARALYRDPEILILDEPNANLDAEGSAALNRVIREMKRAGKAVVIMAHRPSAIEEADLGLILDNGGMVAFGPLEDVLRKHVANHKSIPLRAAT